MNPLASTIKRLREERGWTQGQLGERVGLDHTNVARRENGRTRIKPSERPVFAKAFGMSLLEFDEQWREWEVTRTQGGHGIPVINRAPAGMIVDYEEHGVDSGQGVEYVDWGAISDRLAFAVIVCGESMEPSLTDGDQLVLTPVDPYRGDGKLEDGKIVLARFTAEHGGGCTLARFFAEEDGRILLQKDNPRYKAIRCDREDIELVSVAIERRVKL